MRKTLLTLCACLLNVIIAIAQDDGYYYRYWHTAANVAADNTWTIQEQYGVTFRVESRGIFRYLHNESGGYVNDLTDDEEPKYEYRIYKPKVEVISTEGDEVYIDDNDSNSNIVIRWGNADVWRTGDKNYELQYTYAYPDDRCPTHDYINHSILPDNVTGYIEEFHFDITFDKPLPDDIAKRLRIYSGKFGSTDEVRVQDLVVTPTRISGTLHDIQPLHAVTLFAEMPQGYYTGTRQPVRWPAQLFFYLSIALACLIIYHELCDKRPIITPSVQFYAPKGMTPTLVGKIIDGSTDDIDIAALIPWLAQEGYLKIHDIPKEKGFFGSKADVELTKLRDLPDDAPVYQKNVMKLLFCKGNVLKMSKIGDRHSEVSAAKASVDLIFRGDKKLTETHHELLFLSLIVSSTLCIALTSPIELFRADNVITAGFWGLTFLIAWGIYITTAGQNLFQSKASKVISWIIRLPLFIVVAMAVIGYCADSCISYADTIALLALCYIACELSGRNVHNTPYRSELAGQLKGLREFINTAEKDRLKMLVDQDPAYFYKVLPYAMVFGLTDKWADLFKDIQIEPSPWYSTATAFNAHNFSQSISHTTSSLNKAIKTTAIDHSAAKSVGSSSSHSSGGGGFSGGFSGGGGGGGGAGRW